MLSFPARSMEKVLQKLHELVPHHEAQHPPGISNEKLKEQHDNMVIPKHGPNMSPGLKKLKLRFLKVRFSFWTLHTDIQFMDPWSETLNKIPKSFIIIFHQKEHLIYIIFYHIPRQKKHAMEHWHGFGHWGLLGCLSFVSNSAELRTMAVNPISLANNKTRCAGGTWP